MKKRADNIANACRYIIQEGEKLGLVHRYESGKFRRLISSKRKEISILVDRSSDMYGVKKETLKLILGI